VPGTKGHPDLLSRYDYFCHFEVEKAGRFCSFSELFHVFFPKNGPRAFSTRILSVNLIHLGLRGRELLRFLPKKQGFLFYVSGRFDRYIDGGVNMSNIEDSESQQSDEQCYNVLVADPEDGVFELFEAILATINHQMIRAENGQKALEILEQEDIDLAILNVQLPDRSGLELLPVVKQQNETFIPVVLTSNLADPFAKIEAFKKGADAYQVKPFFPEEFQVVLSSLLRLKDFTDQVISERNELSEMEERLTMKLYDLGKL